MHGWVSPRLGIRFDTSGEELQIFAPDGQPFVSFTTLKQQRQQVEQRAVQAEQERETERTARELAEQRAAELAARLRELGIDPEALESGGPASAEE
jgi:enhancing lycopene biosynthesis protein 2